MHSSKPKTLGDLLLLLDNSLTFHSLLRVHEQRKIVENIRQIRLAETRKNLNPAISIHITQELMDWFFSHIEDSIKTNAWKVFPRLSQLFTELFVWNPTDSFPTANQYNQTYLTSDVVKGEFNNAFKTLYEKYGSSQIQPFINLAKILKLHLDRAENWLPVLTDINERLRKILQFNNAVWMSENYFPTEFIDCFGVPFPKLKAMNPYDSANISRKPDYLLEVLHSFLIEVGLNKEGIAHFISILTESETYSYMRKGNLYCEATLPTLPAVHQPVTFFHGFYPHLIAWIAFISIMKKLNFSNQEIRQFVQILIENKDQAGELLLWDILMDRNSCLSGEYSLCGEPGVLNAYILWLTHPNTRCLKNYLFMRQCLGGMQLAEKLIPDKMEASNNLNFATLISLYSYKQYNIAPYSIPIEEARQAFINSMNLANRDVLSCPHSRGILIEPLDKTHRRRHSF